MNRRAHPGILSGALLCVFAWTACTRQPVGPPVEAELSAIGDDSARRIAELLSGARERPDDAGRRAALGMGYDVTGLFEAAARSYEQAVLLAPDEPRYRYYLAHVDARRGRLERALAGLEEVLVRRSDYVPAHLNRGQWLFDLGRSGEALEAFRAAERLDPHNRAARIGTARILLEQRRFAEATKLLEELLAEREQPYLFPLIGLAYREQGDLERARRVLARTVPGAGLPAWPDPWLEARRAEGRSFADRVLEAGSLLTERRFDEAIPELEALLERSPDHGGMLRALGAAYRETGRPGREIEILRGAVERLPGRPDLHLALGAALRQAGDLPAALAHADRAIEIQPSLGPAHFVRARCLIDTGRYDEALRALDVSLSHDARNAAACLAAGLLETRQRDWGRAVRRFQQAVRLDPSLVTAFVGLGGALAESGRLDDAARALERAAELAPEESPQLAAARRRLAELRAGVASE